MKDLSDMDLKGHLPTFIENFLSDRHFRVRVGTTLSDLHDQEMGVPQGSILSVTLFSVKINNIVKCIQPGVECSLYVDDFLICFRAKNMQTIERQLQLCLNKLQKWCDENGFKFSKTKTVAMHFCKLRKAHPDPELYLDGVRIPVVEEAKFLGLIFDSKLTFVPHLKYLRNKCLKALNLLKVVAHTDWGADRKILLQLYRSLIRSKLDYGCIVYGSAAKSYLELLDPIHNQGLRLCLGAFRTSPVESLYVEANEPSLSYRREKLALQYAVKLRSCPSNAAYNSVFQPNYVSLFSKRTPKGKLKNTPPFGLRVRKHIENSGIDLQQIDETLISDIPPWTLKPPHVIMNLHDGKLT